MIADRSKKARRNSTCPACRTGITVGTSISRVANSWIHTECASRRIRGDTASVTPEEITADLTDEQIRTIADEQGLSGLPLPDARQTIAITRVAAPLLETGIWEKHEAIRLATVSLGLAPQEGITDARQGKARPGRRGGSKPRRSRTG